MTPCFFNKNYDLSSVRYCLYVLMFYYPLFPHRQPATAKWYDTRDSVFIEFCVADSNDVKVSFDKTKFTFRYVCLLLVLQITR